MKIVKGTVKYAAGEPREGQYGPSINVLVTLEDGTAVRVYGKPGDAVSKLKYKDHVQLLDDKGKYKLVEDDTQTMAAPTGIALIEQQLLEKPDIEKQLFDMCALYSKNYVDIYNAMVNAGIPHENATAATSTIFIQVFQKLR